MKNSSSRKGFTVVELVIVIAVIAVLAAVLIPTFSNLVKKANIANDTALAKNINTALAGYKATVSGEMEFKDVIAAARDAGYIISNLNPTTAGHYFVWEKSTNQILLVDGDNDYAVIYANNKDYADIGSTWYFATSNKTAATALKTEAAAKGFIVKDMIAKVEDLSSAIAAGGEVYLDESVILDSTHTLKITESTTDLVVNLGNASLTTDGTINDIPVYVEDGSLTINGGNIGGAGSFSNQFGSFKTAVAADKGDLTMNNVVINNPNGSGVTHGSVVDGPDAEVLVKDCTINAEICINIGGTGSVTIEDVIATGTKSAVWVTWYTTDVTINGGKYVCTGTSDDSECIEVFGYDSKITITDGDFKGGNVLLRATGGSGSSTIVITGGTFNGTPFAELDTMNEWKALCNEGVTITGIGTGTVTISK